MKGKISKLKESSAKKIETSFSTFFLFWPISFKIQIKKSTNKIQQS